MPLLAKKSPLQARLEKDAELRHALQRDVASEIAEQIIRLRRFRGLTQQQLADHIGTGQPAIARHESATSNMRCSTLEAVAGALRGVVRVDVIPEECDHLLDQFPRWWTILDSLSRAAKYEWTFTAALGPRQLADHADSLPSYQDAIGGATAEADEKFASWFVRI